MKNLLFLFTLISLIWSCQPSETSTSKADEMKRYSIEQIMNNESIFGGSISNDKSKVLATSDISGIFNVYAIPTSGGEKTALTQSDSASNFAISYFPNDDRFLFRMDDNGNEIWHIFVKNPDGSSQELTPGAEARAIFYGWAHDGSSFFYGFSQRDPRYMDIYEMDIANFESKMIYENAGAYDFGGISVDKKYMALSKSITTSDSDLFVYNFENKELKKISENRANHSAADFGKDSKSLYYLTNDGGEFNYLMRYDLESGGKEKVVEEKWDIWYAYFSHNGKYRVVGINDDGKTVVKVTETATGNAVEFPQFEAGDISGVSISRDETMASFTLSSSSSPSNLYIYDFGTKKHTKLTNTLNPEINPDDMVTAEVVRYPSFDDLKIPAIYYKPQQASPDNKVPAMVWVHGGPGGQSRQNYHPLIQYLVNHGYAVLAVNNRGSSGYGKTFHEMDNRNHGEKDLMDCVKGKDWLAQQDYIDASKIGIIGGSYGGFMTMAALTSQPEEFDVGVNIYGVTNWLRTLKSIPPWWESFKDALYEEMGDPEQDSVRLYNISPLFHADKITKPVMVLQGATDPRVLQVESDEIVAAVKANKNIYFLKMRDTVL